MSEIIEYLPLNPRIYESFRLTLDRIIFDLVNLANCFEQPLLGRGAEGGSGRPMLPGQSQTEIWSTFSC